MEEESKAPDPEPDAVANPAADEQADHAVRHALAEAVPVADLPDVEEDAPKDSEQMEGSEESPLIAEDAMNGARGVFGPRVLARRLSSALPRVVVVGARVWRSRAAAMRVA